MDNFYSRDNGFTLVEVIIAISLTAILGIGMAQILSMSISTIKWTQAATITNANISQFGQVFSRDVEEANGFDVPSVSSANFTLLCTTGTSSTPNILPLVTISNQISTNITNVTVTVPTITYTVSAIRSLSVNQNVTVTGMAYGNLSQIAAPITAVVGNTFSVTNSSGAPATESGVVASGVATTSLYIGYEVRRNLAGTGGELWRVMCNAPGSFAALIVSDSRILRAGLPLPTATDWSGGVVACPTSLATLGTTSAGICTKNIYLTEVTTNPALQMTVPASDIAASGASSRMQIPIQVLTGVRSVS